LQPPWPDLVIAIGRRSVPVARWIRKQNGGRTKLVRIGHPRIDPGLFELVITTRQYPVPPGGNVLLLPLAMSRFSTPPEPTAEETGWLTGSPAPRRLLAIGGATKYWSLSARLVAEAIDSLQQREGSLIVVTSRRTDPEVTAAVRAVLSPTNRLVEGTFPRFPVLLNSADEIFVTGDSVSMLSEAILAGKPVGLVPIDQDEKGRRKLGEAPQEVGPDARRRDLRRFWDYLRERQLVGTVDQPLAAEVEDPVDTAARAVRDLLGDFR
jgi:mitochondrial fission protein ELM1